MSFPIFFLMVIIPCIHIFTNCGSYSFGRVTFSLAFLVIILFLFLSCPCLFRRRFVSWLVSRFPCVLSVVIFLYCLLESSFRRIALNFRTCQLCLWIKNVVQIALVFSFILPWQFSKHIIKLAVPFYNDWLMSLNFFVVTRDCCGLSRFMFLYTRF